MDETLFPSFPVMPLEDSYPDIVDDSLIALTDSNNARSSISATFRSYCSELFVFGKCHRKDSGCLFDHSAAGQERCIESFYLLAKRELSTHAQLPPWSQVKTAVNPAGLATRSHIPLSRPNQRLAYRPEQRSDRY